jgi:hypothetical protein
MSIIICFSLYEYSVGSDHSAENTFHFRLNEGTSCQRQVKHDEILVNNYHVYKFYSWFLHVVTHMTPARQWLGKHVPKVTLSTTEEA